MTHDPHPQRPRPEAQARSLLSCDMPVHKPAMNSGTAVGMMDATSATSPPD
jgi:hypothetical protein